MLLKNFSTATWFLSKTEGRTPVWRCKYITSRPPLSRVSGNFFSRKTSPHRPTPTATNSCTPKNFLHHRTTIGYIKIFCTFLLKTLDKGGLGILYLHRIDSRKWSVRHSVGQRADHNQKKHIKQSIFLTKDRATLARSQKIIYLYEKIWERTFVFAGRGRNNK